MTSLREKKRDGDCSIDNNHRIHNDPLFKTSVDNKAEKKENASNVVRVSHGINKAKLSERIKLNLAQITEPKLSCFGDGVLEFEIEAPEKNSGQKSCSFNVIKNKSTNMKSIQKLSSLQNWKAVTEQKMKEKRTKEMAERQKLYNMEQLQFSSVAKNLQDDAELEEEEDFSDENVSNGSNSSDDEHLYENELEENNPAIEETCKRVVEKEIIDQLSQETQNSLHLYVDTENQEDDIEIKTIYKDLDMEENMTSQQAFDEAILLLTNPFCKADIIDSTPELNMADSQICSNNITQSTQSIFPEDENANDGSFVEPQTTNGLIMDKQLTSQEAENEILNLLTNPFTKAPCVEDSQTRMSSTQISNRDVKESFKRKIDDFSDIEDEKEINPQEKLSNTIKRSRCAKVVISDDEEDDPHDRDINEKNSANVDSETIKSVDKEDELLAEDDAIEVDSDDEELEMAREIARNKFWDEKKKRIRREFVENEAELSGSDVESDDDDIGSENDELEAEEGDLDDLPSDDVLKAQIGRIHNKQMLDDDHRKLLMYKDAYLADGDLHTDGDVLRRFRWRKPEEDVNVRDVPKDDVEDEIQILEDEVLETWRQIQKERAEFLCEKGLNSQELEEKYMDDAATYTLFSFKKVAVRRSTSTSQATSFASLLETEAHNSPLLASQASTKSRRESFLNRQPSTLHKIVNENSNSYLVSAVNAASSKSLFFAEQSLSFAADMESNNNNSNTSKRTTRIRLKNESRVPKLTNRDVKKDNIDSVFELLK